MWLNTQYLSALAQYERGEIKELQAIDKVVKGMDRAPTAQIDEIVAFVLEQSTLLRVASEESLEASYKKANTMLIVLVLIGATIGTIVTWRVIVGISRPISRAVAVAQTVASGDLSTEITVTSNDETGQLMAALKEMNESLNQTVSSVREGTDSIASSSAEIADANQNLASRTMEQASSLDETAASMEELTSIERSNADSANQANDLASKASVVAVEGGDVVSEVVTTMSSINESSRKMADIIGVIDGIAFQTNILALNAAVEAARAGEQGRGFAVVADEVRNLAQKSASAARDIRELIDSSVEKVDAGSELVERAGSTMEDVVSSIQQVKDIVEQIARASTEQCDSIEGVNAMVVKMNTLTQENAAMVEEAAAATESMQAEATTLANQVGAFRLSSGQEKVVTEYSTAQQLNTSPSYDPMPEMDFNMNGNHQEKESEVLV